MLISEKPNEVIKKVSGIAKEFVKLICFQDYQKSHAF